jgi:hypothetical protein
LIQKQLRFGDTKGDVYDIRNNQGQTTIKKKNTGKKTPNKALQGTRISSAIFLAYTKSLPVYKVGSQIHGVPLS